MINFGELKTRFLTKLVESYNSGNKNELKGLIKKLKSNKNLVEMHHFYEEMENTYIEDKNRARIFVEGLEPMLVEKSKTIGKDSIELYESLMDVVVENNELYSCLDILSENESITNLLKKIEAREKLVDFLTTKKEKVAIEESSVKIENEKLLNTVLVNNFNIKYGDFLTGEDKNVFENIVSMSNEDLINETNTIKSELTNKIESLLNESTDDSMIKKLNDVKSEINQKEITKFNYFKLIELRKGLI